MMRSERRIVLLAATLAIGAGTAAVVADHHEEAYHAMADAWEAAYNTGDAAAVAAFYLEDGMRMPPHATVVNGREAIQAQIQEGMDMGLAKIDITTVESKVWGDEGWARGTWVGMDAEGNTLDQGKWMQIGRLVDGKWHAAMDIWNSDLPMPQ